MNKVVRRLLIWAVFTVVAGFAALVVIQYQQSPNVGAQGAGGKTNKVDTATVDVAVQPDARLIVTERLKFVYAGSFHGGYRDIPFQNGVTASDVSVSDSQTGRYRPGGDPNLGSDDAPGKFGVTDLPGGGLRIVWHFDQQDGSRTLVLRYTVRGVAKAYDDSLVVPWAPWGDQWTFWLNHLHARVRVAQPPSGSAKPLEAWLRPGNLGVTPTISAAGAEITLDRSKPQQQVALTAAFPRGVVSSTRGAVTKAGNGLALTRAAEDKATSGGFLGKLASAVAKIQGWLLLLWTLLVGGIAMGLYRQGREYDTSTPDYVPGPPQPLSPAVGYALANEGDYTDRVVLATLLDLVDRGYYKAEPTEGKDLDLRLSIVEPRPTTPVEPYEATVLGFFDGLLANGGPCPLGELKDRIPEHSAEWRGRWESMNKALDTAGDDLLEWDRDLRPKRGLLALVAVIGYAAITYLAYSRTGYWSPGIAALFSGLGLIYLLPSDWLQRRTQASIEAGEQWAAFAKWTKDFPNLDDDPPATLALWRRVLVYAVAFGTAERVAKSGRIPAPVAQQDDGWSRGLTSGAMYGGLAGSSFGHGFSSQVAPQSSSSGSGGGGGGGGGFSGGGGGGSW